MIIKELYRKKGNISMNGKRFYTNPVMKGFYPDPSVIRVDDDYYMVNSTFQYFPAVVISHSRDLVNWEIIGHAITENDYLDISDIYDSHGIWAPDISYHNGTFYIFAPLRLNGAGTRENNVLRRQLMVKSDKPEGPYSKPVCLEVDHIDPSHFVDDDGSNYLVVAPGITLVKLNDDCTKVLSEPVTIWAGTGAKAPEGPHILKKDGYYYAILAEGGTGYGHRISVARAQNLYGPYEFSPYNPVMIQLDPKAKIQRAGHGMPVQTKKGDWWMMYLCGRPNEGNFTTIGRETALDPIHWTEDGWFLVNKSKGPSQIQEAPDLPEYKVTEQNFDHFDGEQLGLEWQFVRNPDHSAWSLKERPGYLRIWTGDADLNARSAKNTLVRREKHHNYTVSVKLEFNPTRDGEQAGLTCYYSTNTYIKFCLIYENGRKLQLVENRGNKPQVVCEVDQITEGSVYLKVTVNKQVREFSYSYDSEIWTQAEKIVDCTYLSDEGVPAEKKRHTGTLVGVYANNGGSGSRIPADFDWFSYTYPDERPVVFIAGDSTVRNHDHTNPTRFGWGQKLNEFFSSEIKVINEAVPGRSSKSFKDEERLLPIKNRIKANDYFLIQFGHNDEKPDAARRTESYTTYKAYLKEYIEVARTNGAYPVLLTSVNRRHFNDHGELVDTHGEYPKAMRELAKEMNVPLIDLEAKTWKLYESLGDDESKKLFFWLNPGESPDYPDGVEDNTHFNAYGAKIIAGLVAEGIQEVGLPLGKYLISKK
jgi:xylan 1,4-beta-xylosidase